MTPQDDETVELKPGQTRDPAPPRVRETPVEQTGGTPVPRPSTLGLAELLLLGLDSPFAETPASGKKGTGPDYAGEPWIGRLIGDYRIEEELGRGGMGMVFRATNVRVGSTVALKLLRFAPGESAERIRRFELEARSAAALNHPHIINVFDVGQVGDLYYLAMEYIVGRPLSEKIRNGPLDPQQAARITQDVCSALECAHEAGVIHRDIKPSNILIESTGRAQLMDFGLARSLYDAEGAKKLTEEGSILGTVHYMSPEQALGQSHAADSRSDIYSVGAVLYEMVTGQSPFDGRTPLDVVRKVALEEPLRPRRLCPALDRDLEIVILKAMEKDPARRYRSAGALAEDLWRFQAGEPILARAPSLLYRTVKGFRKHRTWTLPAALALAGVGLVTLGFFLHDRKLVQSFESETQAHQVEIEETLRQRMLEWEVQRLQDSIEEHWRFVHALRLDGKPREALQELELFPPASTSGRPPDFDALFWKGILKREAGLPEADGALAAAEEYARKARRDDWAALVKLYLAVCPFSADAGTDPSAQARFLYHQGHAALLRGDKMAAAACYRRALEGHPRCQERVFAAIELSRLEAGEKR